MTDKRSSCLVVDVGELCSSCTEVIPSHCAHRRASIAGLCSPVRSSSRTCRCLQMGSRRVPAIRYVLSKTKNRSYILHVDM